MIADIFFIILFLVIVHIGWKTGSVVQAIRLVALIIAVAVSPFVAIKIQDIAFGQTQQWVQAQYVGSFVASMIGLYVLISVLGWIFASDAHNKESRENLSASDRSAGALLAAVKSFVTVYLLVFLFLMVMGSLEQQDQDDLLRLQNGHITTWVERNHLLAPWQLPDLQALHQCATMAHNGQSTPAAIFNDAIFRNLMLDESFVSAATSSNYIGTASNSDVRRALSDDGFVSVLRNARCQS